MGLFMIISGLYVITRGYDIIAGKILWKGGIGQLYNIGKKIILPLKKELRLTIKQKKGDKNVKYEDKILNDKD